MKTIPSPGFIMPLLERGGRITVFKNAQGRWAYDLNVGLKSHMHLVAYPEGESVRWVIEERYDGQHTVHDLFDVLAIYRFWALKQKAASAIEEPWQSLLVEHDLLT